jgi:hypothetical protein
VIDRVAIGYSPADGPDRVLANWVILLLPYLEQENLYKRFDLTKAVDDSANAEARATTLSAMLCPSDPYNNKPYERATLAGVTTGHAYARGNYAINGGPDNNCMMSQAGCSNGFYVDSPNLLDTNMHVWGSGVAGLNLSFRFRDFPAGLSQMACIDEIRAGIDPVDPRGVWALGMAGASVTVRDGIYTFPNSAPPNNVSPVGDVIVGCSALLAKYGIGDLMSRGMPCQENAPAASLEATSRSMHPGGVHVMLLDGSAQFVSENVNPAVWHDLHSRNTVEMFNLPFE